MKQFSELWDWVMKRTERGVMTVQERSELEHVFNLMRGCDCSSYLEVGTAEGNSLYVLGHAVNNDIHYVDLGEKHTEQPRNEAISKINEIDPNNFSLGRLIKLIHITGFFGDSTKPETYPHHSGIQKWAHDCILIDGGHDFATVLSDSILYAPLATKYVFWHDIQLPEVRAAWEWFKKRRQLGEYSTFINSDSFGYGICKIKQ